MEYLQEKPSGKTFRIYLQERSSRKIFFLNLHENVHGSFQKTFQENINSCIGLSQETDSNMKAMLKKNNSVIF